MVQPGRAVHFNSTNVRMHSWRRSITRLGLHVLGRVAPRRTRQMIESRFFAPRPYVTTPLEDQALQRGRCFTLQVHDKSIHGWQWGDGPPILFVHGWNGRGIQFLPFFASVIAAGHAVIAVDGPAHGESTGQTANYFEFTDMVRQIIDPRSGFAIRGIMAHSLGAAAVISALAHEGAAIDAVLIAAALRLKELLHNTFARYGVPRGVFAPIIGQLEARFGYGLDRDNPIRAASRVRSRLLLIHDPDDAVTPFADAKELADGDADFSLHATQGLGHQRILADPAVVETAVQFLTGNQRQAIVAGACEVPEPSRRQMAPRARRTFIHAVDCRSMRTRHAISESAHRQGTPERRSEEVPDGQVH